MTRPLAPLETVLKYENSDVVGKFLERYHVTNEEAVDLFVETKKWLWLCAKAARSTQSIVPFIETSTRMIDEMWHTFILFTKDYAAFCLENFGLYIHHKPVSSAEKQDNVKLWTEDPAEFDRIRRRQLEQLYRFIQNELGEATLVKWTREYRAQYPVERLEKVAKALI